MYIKVYVVAGSRKESIEKKSPTSYKIAVREKAERNLANTRVRELIAEELGTNVSAVRIINGHHSPGKLLSVLTEKSG